MSNFKKFCHRFAGKGYYIALVLCAVAIGITGILYYRNTQGDSQPDALANAPADPTVEAGAPMDPTATAPEKAAPDLKTGLPVAGETLAGYAMDCLSYNATTRDWRVHDGMDIAAEAGTEVCAAAGGEVYTVYDDEVMGTTVVLRHEGGYVTTYSSLDENVSVAPGDKVTLGQPIGTAGSTAAVETAIGDHVHFSVRLDDKSVDPAEFLGMD